jgi:pyruvate dehydrogenase E2 component (dihydrolipoamide acetyltransferase)
LAESKQIRVPDIGNAKNVDVIEVLVKSGDKISENQSLMTLESDKASMEIPAPFAGIVEQIQIKVGDKVSEGDVILTVRAEAAKPSQEPAQAKTSDETVAAKIEEVMVPDIGNAKDVDVIEVLVKPGDKVEKEQSLITLEGDKATMEIPAPFAGEIKDVKIKVGDKASQGTLILTMSVTDQPEQSNSNQISKTEPTKESQPQGTKAVQPAKPETPEPAQAAGMVHAGPAVRRIAREFGVDLAKVTASGPKQRILKEDVQNYVKATLAKPASSSAMGLPQAPVVDFSQFGDTEVKPLTKIKRLTGSNLHRNWLIVPHVTQFDEADITELEAFRNAEKANAEKQGYKLTPLIFIMKAVVAALKAYPQFNASLDASGESLIMKKYYHVGVAVDTPNGLVVPVIRDVDKKSVYDLAKELAEISKKAREKGLSINDMQGGCFSISSLGGIGGTAFTPIVNLPEVAILGVSKAQMKPIYTNGQFEPRLMLPLSLSYDHRVIDGADGARFTSYLAHLLADIRRVLL